MPLRVSRGTVEVVRTIVECSGVAAGPTLGDGDGGLTEIVHVVFLLRCDILLCDGCAQVVVERCWYRWQSGYESHQVREER